MALLNNEGLRFLGREKVFWKRNGETVRIDKSSVGSHLKSYLAEILSIRSHQRLTKIPDRKFQNLD